MNHTIYAVQNYDATAAIAVDNDDENDNADENDDDENYNADDENDDSDDNYDDENDNDDNNNDDDDATAAFIWRTSYEDTQMRYTVLCGKLSKATNTNHAVYNIMKVQLTDNRCPLSRQCECLK